VRKLHDDIARVVADPDYQSTLAARGFVAQASTPQQLATFLENDYVRFRKLINKLGLKLE
jgi:tripartite-type tricarboxylate transporter receptor subunit TctC